MKKQQLKVVNQREIADNIFELTLASVVSCTPGQFFHVKVADGFDPLLRRPISIAAVDHSSVTLIYRKEGRGTTLLSTKMQGETVDVLGPLGNGFPLDAVRKGQTALLVGGGIGVPPLYELSKRLVERGVRVIHVHGFASAAVAFYEDEFAELGTTYVATVDGSRGTKGFVTDVIDRYRLHFDTLYACGPTPMLKALEARYRDKNAYFSLEQRMGCGIGACFACVCHTQADPEGFSYRKVCSDGPVFPVGEVVL